MCSIVHQTGRIAKANVRHESIADREKKLHRPRIHVFLDNPRAESIVTRIAEQKEKKEGHSCDGSPHQFAG
jgi:transposase